MSAWSCTTATAARRGRDGYDRRLRRRLFFGDEAGDNDLEARLRDLERGWSAYKASHSGAPRSRRSAVTTGAPSSAVTDADVLPGFLCCSPRRLVFSLQQDDSGGGGGTVSDEPGTGGQLREDEEDDASSVCSVEVACPVSPASPRSCPRQCAALCRSCSTSSPCPEATESEFSSPVRAGGGGVTVRARETEDVSRVMRNNPAVKLLTAVVAFVVVGVIVAMTVMELGMDDEEFLVPT